MTNLALVAHFGHHSPMDFLWGTEDKKLAA